MLVTYRESKNYSYSWLDLYQEESGHSRRALYLDALFEVDCHHSSKEPYTKEPLY